MYCCSCSFVAGQQFQQSLEFNNPAVRLAGPGFFQQGGSLSSRFSFDNSRNNQFQNRGSIAQFSPLSNNRDSESIVSFQNENQFQFGGISFQQNQQNTFNSLDNENRDRFQAQSLQQNPQNIFSTGAFQQDGGNQFQSSSSLSSSQINDGFSLGLTQGLSSSQPQTFTDNQQDSRSNRPTAINVQLTPSVRFQDQQITGTSFQSNRNQQNNDNRFQQTSFTGTRFVNNNNNNNNNNIQFNTNSQVSSTSQLQSSNRRQLNAASSLSQFTDEVNGVFEPLNLPSGATLLLGRISSSFSCADRPYGYYADQENSCRVFHVCNPALFSDGKIETYQYSFMCGEGTVFDQDELTCKVEYDATPCQEAANFYFRNEQFGRLEDRNF
ncbi:probable serine/threonine-protein kinase DDB_G0278845 [Macrobrachium nipponense]|uniref:probable serine/threonine-protein kinase DDB_G0278845 n=1 Tax=Macrobrachium nipponense TaxID=159736 RepID=UPI0030C7CB99